MTDQNNLWPEYQKRFPYSVSKLLRKGCHPRKLVHSQPADKAIVLIHGLTDSPAMMLDLARDFHVKFNYNVYLPLLHCHGQQNPDRMLGVSLKEWKENIRFSLEAASADCRHVSLGGLSTGGALAFYFGCLDRRVNQNIFLFSAAFGLYRGWLGRIKEAALRTPLAILRDRLIPGSLVGKNPYRYSYVPFASARELVVLMDEIRSIRNGKRKSYLPDRRIFNAWSASDRVIDPALLQALSSAPKEGLWKRRSVCSPRFRCWAARVSSLMPTGAASFETTSKSRLTANGFC